MFVTGMFSAKLAFGRKFSGRKPSVTSPDADPGGVCDAQAVAYSFQRHLDVKRGLAASGRFRNVIAAVAASDPATVHFTLKTPYPAFTRLLAIVSAGIVSPAADRHGLLAKTPGKREPGDAWVEKLAGAIYSGKRVDAAGAVAEALADGISPDAIGEALAELLRLAAEGVVGKLFELRLEGVDALDRLGKVAQHAVVTAAENARQGTIEHRSSGSETKGIASKTKTLPARRDDHTTGAP